ncbi:hypothetical protein N825_12025 [Skermanella stibiiresistens SB22]|uniref:histidine kinase n=1 Tax=Skermanella stibiiresistens SB22 TaxID=1385369 RepID=W9H133_9PROT|nr:sensor histidine kinase [Skermanella stibiiresistens]EWY38531.1 hypothetical protein N825_12025 [Skermanella stibiiresistens SB22]
MADERTCSGPKFRDLEYEQLQTAFETAETELHLAVEENRQLEAEKSRMAAENARLRHLLAQSYSRLLEAQVSAEKRPVRPLSGLERELGIVNEELQISLEELQVTVEELEETNSSLLLVNETLEQQVAERTRHLELALAERDELLRCKDQFLNEIGHRVSDSLRIVMSLIRIQADRSVDPSVQAALQTAEARVQAVAQVHDRLFTGGGSGRVRMDRYLGEMCQQIAKAIGGQTGTRGSPQTLEIEVEPVELSADLAFPLGLIVTELVGNALRHAFDSSGEGTVWVQFGRVPDDKLKLVVADDGKGVPQRVDFSGGIGMGMHIVALMVRRLRATLSVTHVHGTCYTLTLPGGEFREATRERPRSIGDRT